jgi:hypothetical protein
MNEDVKEIKVIDKFTDEVLYTKSQLLKSSKYTKNIDLINVILKEDVKYSILEVDKLIKNFMKGKVK